MNKSGFEKAIHKEAVKKYEADLKELALSFKKYNFGSLKFNEGLEGDYDTVVKDRNAVEDFFDYRYVPIDPFRNDEFERFLEINFKDYEHFKENRIAEIEEKLIHDLFEQLKESQASNGYKRGKSKNGK